MCHIIKNAAIHHLHCVIYMNLWQYIIYILSYTRIGGDTPFIFCDLREFLAGNNLHCILFKDLWQYIIYIVSYRWSLTICNLNCVFNLHCIFSWMWGNTYIILPSSQPSPSLNQTGLSWPYFQLIQQPPTPTPFCGTCRFQKHKFKFEG